MNIPKAAETETRNRASKRRVVTSCSECNRRKQRVSPVCRTSIPYCNLCQSCSKANTYNSVIENGLAIAVSVVELATFVDMKEISRGKKSIRSHPQQCNFLVMRMKKRYLRIRPRRWNSQMRISLRQLGLWRWRWENYCMYILSFQWVMLIKPDFKNNALGSVSLRFQPWTLEDLATRY